MKSLWIREYKVVRQCESKNWFTCGVDGRSVGRWVYGHVKFSGWVDLLSYGALPTHARNVRVELRYKGENFLLQ